MLKQQEQLQKDLHIDLIQGAEQNDDAENHLATGLGLHENSRATIHNVPPLALPTSDTATEFLQVSRMPSSHRNINMSYSTSSLTKIKQMAHQQESQKVLNSFNANNVRANFKGIHARKLI